MEVDGYESRIARMFYVHAETAGKEIFWEHSQ